MRDPSSPSFVGLTLVQWRFLFGDRGDIRVETHDEDNKITSQSLLVLENILMASAGL